jgi:tetratricopeptide (TPR) repeat protein
MWTLLMLAVIAATPSQTGKFGRIDFKVTGSRECQTHFTQGMLALHSFVYDEAHAAFQAAGPHCPMALWGDAMAYSHPIWNEVELDPARQALAKVADGERMTPKERAYLGAARDLFGDGDTDERQRAWLEAAAQMQRDFPNDDEVALQHALALLAPGNNDHFRNVRRLMESAAIAMDVYHRHPDHPGAAHYTIHACDSPDHAILALPEARAYASIAPAASHALHMPSHIFVQLGMWADVAASNEASWAVDVAKFKAKHTPLAARDLHSYSWLAAAYSEQGQRKKANQLLSDLRGWLDAEDGPAGRYGYANIAHLLIRNGDRWDEAETVMAPLAKPLPLEKGESPGSLGCAMHAPGAEGKVRPPFGLIAQLIRVRVLAEAAMRRGDEAEVRKQNDELARWLPALDPWKGMLSKDLAENVSLGAQANLAGARAHVARTPEAWTAAIAAFEKVAAISDATGPSGPAFDTPARQLLAEIELDAGHAKEALADFDRVLETHPMLSRALLGAARAAKAAGDMTGARARYAELLSLWAHADDDLAEVSEVRSGAVLASAE